MEVASMELLAPDRLVHHPQFGDREWLGHERGGQRRVLKLRPGPFQAVGDDFRMVEGEPSGRSCTLPAITAKTERVDRHPGGYGGGAARPPPGRLPPATP